MIRLEKVYKETSQERGVPKQTPKKKPENKKNTGKRYADGKGKKITNSRSKWDRLFYRRENERRPEQ